MDLTSRFRYVFHFDELTWIPGSLSQPYYEVKIEYSNRHLFMEWLEENTTGQIYIWSGVISPQQSQTNWGGMISPHKDNTFITFMAIGDQVRFNLEFLGAPDGMVIQKFRNGLDAYYYRTR